MYLRFLVLCRFNVQGIFLLSSLLSLWLFLPDVDTLP
jgi:hypothetical protein